MQPTLVVLAAGMGSRYKGLKQVDPVGPSGETIIDYSVYDAIRAGFDKLVFIIRHDIEEPFRASIGKRFENRINVEYAFQELDKLLPGFTVPPDRAKPWGTGHALLVTKEVVKTPFAAINADDFYGRHSFQMLADHLRSGTPDYAMVGFVLRNTLSEFGTVARGECKLSGDYLTGVTELTAIERDGSGAKYTDEKGQKHSLTGDEIVSMNMWGFTPALFPQLERLFIRFLTKYGNEPKREFYIPSAVNTLLVEKSAKVKVLRTTDTWFGMTYREDRPRVTDSINKLVKDGVYPERLWT
jgi:UTP-glucose-1-phosphate uridylyltransferase